MNEKLKEPRIYLCIAIFVMLFLPWMSLSASANVAGVSASSSQDLSGINVLQACILGILIYIIPLIMLLVELVPSIQISPKLIYLFGSVLGIIAAFVTTILAKSMGSTSFSAGGSSAESHVSYKLGFWITIGLFVAIIIVTLIKDFALSKDSIKEKGLKGALSEVASDVGGQLSQQANIDLSGLSNNISGLGNNISNLASSINIGTKCPSCGANIAPGKKFCAKCGNKLPEQPAPEASSSQGPSATFSAKPSGKGKNVSNEPLTVKNYLAALNSVSCEKCGATVPVDKKFCPDCGEKITLKATPEQCEKCHAPLIGSKKFCPDCGEKVHELELFTNCTKCGADLFFGKKYCVECGAKAGESES